MKEMVGGCCVCSDERGWPDNPLVYCDGNGCTVAVHQACYGIVTVPVGPWYCRKCESPETKGKVRCELCPSKSGALKRSDTGGWAHVVCALYIPEVRFGNVTSMEPIVLRLIPPERYNKTCYICQEQGKSHRATAGACMQCNKAGCKQQFHVTCAQGLGLLCEEAGNYLDNVKYCGYCQHHYSKLKKGGNVKTIPPYKPVSHDSQSSDSSGEKEGDGSPKASGGATPTHGAKKGSGRKASNTSTSATGKNAATAKTPTNTTQPIESTEEPAEVAPPARKHKNNKGRKSSPSRRGSSAGEGGSGSKSSTPAPSPQHQTGEPSPAHGSKGSTPNSASKVSPPRASPSSVGSVKSQEPVGVISSAPAASPAATPPSATAASVVQPAKAKPTFQESVITNTESLESKQTKKRKAANAANSNAAAEFASTPPPATVTDTPTPPANMWDASLSTDVNMENVEKIKKAKTEVEPPAQAHYQQTATAPPPQSPSAQPSPRPMASPRPGTSGVPTSQPNIRSPSQQHVNQDPASHSPQMFHQQPKQDRRPKKKQPSLPVSLKIPPDMLLRILTLYPSKVNSDASHSPHVYQPPPNKGNNESVGPHIFYQPQKQAAMEPSVSAHSPHAVPVRNNWTGLNVSYEMQQPDNNKPGASKDVASNTGAIRNKKRAAMTSTVVSGQDAAMQTTNMASMSNVRHPPPVFQETIKDSPPSSPGSERPLKPKYDNRSGSNCTAPHMLGNELNPESGAAARLQEQLTAELAAHAAHSATNSPLVPPPLFNKASQGASSSRSGSSAQSLDQLLERQWEQGSQFLMEQAQHFDIASLLSCLHQLRTENVRLEEHVGNLLQRRDHLLAVNARLAIPLSSAGAPETPRGGRDSSQMRAPQGPPVNAERSHQLLVRDAQQKPS